MRIGSQRTRHSQIDHKFDNEASKRDRGDGTNGAVVARIFENQGLYESIHKIISLTHMNPRIVFLIK